MKSKNKHKKVEFTHKSLPQSNEKAKIMLQKLQEHKRKIALWQGSFLVAPALAIIIICLPNHFFSMLRKASFCRIFFGTLAGVNLANFLLFRVWSWKNLFSPMLLSILLCWFVDQKFYTHLLRQEIKSKLLIALLTGFATPSMLYPTWILFWNMLRTLNSLFSNKKYNFIAPNFDLGTHHDQKTEKLLLAIIEECQAQNAPIPPSNLSRANFYTSATK